MRAKFLVAMWCGGLVLLRAQTNESRPLPNASELKERALGNMARSQELLERYSCTVHGSYDEFDKNGAVKKRSTRLLERFYVNGLRVDHLLERDGKVLTGGDAEKEQKKTDDEVRKLSDEREAAKRRGKREQQTEMFLRAQKLTNARRESRWGYNTISYDLAGDPNFKPRSLEERVAHAMNGRIWIDEASGAPVELQIRTDRDVKIGGGLVASLHKGFEFKLIEHRQPDGVWLVQSVEGTGDARAALFLHPRFRFREDMKGCRLFSVEATDAAHATTKSQEPEKDR